jgi:hypothetical protein
MGRRAGGTSGRLGLRGRPKQSVFVVTFAASLVSDQDPVVSGEHKELRLVPTRDVEMLRMPEGYKRSIRMSATLPQP